MKFGKAIGYNENFLPGVSVAPRNTKRVLLSTFGMREPYMQT